MCQHRHRDRRVFGERKPNFMTFLESQSQEFITFNPLFENWWENPPFKYLLLAIKPDLMTYQKSL